MILVILSVAFILHSASLISACHAADDPLPQLVAQTIYSKFCYHRWSPLDQVWETMAATGGPALPEVVPLYFLPLHVINVTSCVYGGKSYVIVCIGYVIS